jgi:hypothetical protein
VTIIPTFRGIVVQVRIFGLKGTKNAFPAEIALIKMKEKGGQAKILKFFVCPECH